MTRGAALRSMAALLLVLAAAPLAAQAPLTITTRDGAPLVRVRGVLEDEALEEAVRSGLPLRMQFRVELWRDRLFDQLSGEARWSAAVAYEPLEGVFLVGEAGADSVVGYPDWAAAAEALERAYAPVIGPDRPGRYYYIAALAIETLSLSDLDELERWLRGELEPAVRGGGSVGGALGTGVKRILIRVLGLPARRYEARSDPFRIR